MEWGRGGEEGGKECIKDTQPHTIEMEFPTIRHSHPSNLAGIATGVFIAQVLAKSAANILLPHDDTKPVEQTDAISNAMWSTVHQDATLMPAAIALLRNTKTA